MDINNINLEQINIISDYLKLPKDSYYRDFLLKKLSDESISFLKEQEGILEEIKVMNNLEFNFEKTISDTIDKDLNKIQSKKNSYLTKSIEFCKPLLLSFSCIVSSIGLTFFGIDKIKENTDFLIDKNIKILDKINVLEKVEKNPKYFEENIKMNTDADKKEKDNLNMSNFKIYLEDEELEVYNFDSIENFGYSGDIKKYRSIDSGFSKNKIDLLKLADNELSKNTINLSRINKYLYKTLLEQHEVEIIEDKNGGK
jgi:hypothetical protein